MGGCDENGVLDCFASVFPTPAQSFIISYMGDDETDNEEDKTRLISSNQLPVEEIVSAPLIR